MTMAAYADACVAALDARGIDHFDLLGLSWGGALAQELTLRHPDRGGGSCWWPPCTAPGRCRATRWP
ncbi:MAG: alpha/beta hydrolase [Acidimicrobiales bacterium]